MVCLSMYPTVLFCFEQLQIYSKCVSFFFLSFTIALSCPVLHCSVLFGCIIVLQISRSTSKFCSLGCSLCLSAFVLILEQPLKTKPNNFQRHLMPNCPESICCKLSAAFCPTPPPPTPLVKDTQRDFGPQSQPLIKRFAYCVCVYMVCATVCCVCVLDHRGYPLKIFFYLSIQPIQSCSLGPMHLSKQIQDRHSSTFIIVSLEKG